jgi:hypothetical protein
VIQGLAVGIYSTVMFVGVMVMVVMTVVVVVVAVDAHTRSYGTW